jgi:signal peptidase I
MSTNLNSIKTNENQDLNLMGEVYEWIEAIVFAFVFVIILFTFVFRVVGVEGISMKNTLNREINYESQTLDRIIITITNFTYVPKQGDIIVLAHQSDNTNGNNYKSNPESVPYIKRIIALAGQTVNLENGEVYVDGIKLKEKYIIGKTDAVGDVKFPVKVPPNCVFVMGDNRSNSLDSRYSRNMNGVGMLDVRNILGKAIFRIYPFKQIGVL